MAAPGTRDRFVGTDAAGDRARFVRLARARPQSLAELLPMARAVVMEMFDAPSHIQTFCWGSELENERGGGAIPDGSFGLEFAGRLALNPAIAKRIDAVLSGSLTSAPDGSVMLHFREDMLAVFHENLHGIGPQRPAIMGADEWSHWANPAHIVVREGLARLGELRLPPTFARRLGLAEDFPVLVEPTTWRHPYDGASATMEGLIDTVAEGAGVSSHDLLVTAFAEGSGVRGLQTIVETAMQAHQLDALDPDQHQQIRDVLTRRLIKALVPDRNMSGSAILSSLGNGRSRGVAAAVAQRRTLDFVARAAARGGITPSWRATPESVARADAGLSVGRLLWAGLPSGDQDRGGASPRQRRSSNAAAVALNGFITTLCHGGNGDRDSTIATMAEGIGGADGLRLLGQQLLNARGRDSLPYEVYEERLVAVCRAAASRFEEVARELESDPWRVTRFDALRAGFTAARAFEAALDAVPQVQVAADDRRPSRAELIKPLGPPHQPVYELA